MVYREAKVDAPDRTKRNQNATKTATKARTTP
jgi:hypothetical protein